MFAFEENMSSAENAEDKTLSPDFKQIATSQAQTSTQQAGIAQGLSTSESTSDSDTARLEAEKARRETEIAAALNATIPASQFDRDAASVTMNSGENSAESTQIVTFTNKSSNDALGEAQRNYIEKQKNAVIRVLKCASNKYYQILEVKDSSTKEEIKKAYKGLSLLLHSDKNKYKDAEETFKRRQNSVILAEDISDFSLLCYLNARLTS